jgi:hypothetical protein
MNKPKRPPLVTVVVILQLVFGGLFMCCGVFGAAASFFSSSSGTMTIRDFKGDTTTRPYDPKAEMEREAPSYKTFLIVGTVADFLLHFMMIGGAIGLLLMQPWGWWVSVAWAPLRLVYQLGTAGYLWLVAMPACNRVVQALPPFSGVGDLANGNTFFHLFWALSATAFTLYPIIIGVLLILPQARRVLSPAAADVLDDPDAEDRPRRRRPRVEEEEPEEEAPRRRPARDDEDEDEPRPRRR